MYEAMRYLTTQPSPKVPATFVRFVEDKRDLVEVQDNLFVRQEPVFSELHPELFTTPQFHDDERHSRRLIDVCVEPGDDVGAFNFGGEP